MPRGKSERSMEETLELSLHETRVKLQGLLAGDQSESRAGLGSEALKDKSCCESLDWPLMEEPEAEAAAAAAAGDIVERKKKRAVRKTTRD